MRDEPEGEGRDDGAAASRAGSDRSVSGKGGARAAETVPERPRPVDRSLRWVPRKLRLSGREVDTPADVFVPRTVLRELRERIRPVAESGDDVGGILGGRLFRCPESGRSWVRVDSVHPLSVAFPEEADADQVGAALEAAREALDAAGERPVGWYHSHSLLGVFLSDRDVQLHRRFFPEPWQCALVLVADDRRPAGGLFQALNGELPRSVYVPFHELADEDEGAGMARNSVVGWENYTPDAPARPTAALRGGASARAAGAPTGGSGAGDAAGGRARAPDGAPRRAPLESGHPAEVPLVLPAEEGADLWDRWEEHRGTLLRLGAVLLVLLGGWLLWDRVLDRPAGTSGAAAERPAAEATAGEGAGAAASDRQRPAEFERAVAAFSMSVESYEERSADFDLGRIGCEGLQIGYRSVDEAFVAASEAFVGVRDQAFAPPTGRYEEAARRMEEVDRHFDASGCPRPD